jgi:hypothetical protein
MNTNARMGPKLVQIHFMNPSQQGFIIMCQIQNIFLRYRFTERANAWLPTEKSCIFASKSTFSQSTRSLRRKNFKNTKIQCEKCKFPQQIIGSSKEVSPNGEKDTQKKHTHTHTENTKSSHCFQPFFSLRCESFELLFFSREWHCEWRCQSDGICKEEITTHSKGRMSNQSHKFRRACYMTQVQISVSRVCIQCVCV